MTDSARRGNSGPAQGSAVRLPAVGARIGVESSRMSGRLWTTLVGFREGSYILIETPEAEIPVGMSAPFTEEDVLTIRYVDDGTVFGFRAPVLGRVRAPVPLTVIAYPRQAQTHALRQHPRLSCNLPCRGRIGKHEFPRAVLRDVSDFGCQLRIAGKDLPADLEELPADTVIEVEVEVPSESGTGKVTEKIRGHVVGVEGHEGYAMIRVRTEAKLDALMSFLSTFTTRLQFEAD